MCDTFDLFEVNVTPDNKATKGAIWEGARKPLVEVSPLSSLKWSKRFVSRLSLQPVAVMGSCLGMTLVIQYIKHKTRGILSPPGGNFP